MRPPPPGRGGNGGAPAGAEGGLAPLADEAIASAIGADAPLRRARRAEGHVVSDGPLGALLAGAPALRQTRPSRPTPQPQPPEVDVAMVGIRSASLLPGFFVSCGIIYALLVAATVSEKCGRVPAFINAFPFGPGTDRQRQHIVEYIAYSGAGFYILDTRLTTSIVAKMTYVWCIVVVGAWTKFSPPEK